ncbi:MAG: iron-containing alcohol dehydrogenase [Erysipelotrichaceae bacterium]|nr:iron-containing alcohol dehydrogenase [Erysipelotrichaceae bacterium]
MMKDFSFQNTTKVHFGQNAMDKMYGEMSQYGTKVLLVYGGAYVKTSGLFDKVVSKLGDLKVYEYDKVVPNPRHTDINEGAKMCRDNDIDMVLALGGGSAIDSAKAIASLTKADVDDIWEIVKARKPITKALPIFTLPTMASTGSEMDQSAVISNVETEEKIGIFGPAVRPTVTFDDPTLTYTVPPYQTACGSVDIMAHTIDTKYFSRDDKMDMLYRMCDQHLKTVVKWAPVAMVEPDNYEARANLLWAAAWALNSFMTCGVQQVSSVHAMDHELGGVYNIVHGHGIAILMPRWLRYILNEETAPQIARMAYNVFDIDQSIPVMDAAVKAIDMMEDLFYNTLGLKSHLSDLNIDDSRFEEMAKNACGANGVIRGFVDLYPEDVVEIFKLCL